MQQQYDSNHADCQTNQTHCRRSEAGVLLHLPCTQCSHCHVHCLHTLHDIMQWYDITTMNVHEGYPLTQDSFMQVAWCNTLYIVATGFSWLFGSKTHATRCKNYTQQDHHVTYNVVPTLKMLSRYCGSIQLRKAPLGATDQRAVLAERHSTSTHNVLQDSRRHSEPCDLIASLITPPHKSKCGSCGCAVHYLPGICFYTYASILRVHVLHVDKE